MGESKGRARLKLIRGRNEAWKRELIRNRFGNPKPLLENCLIALRYAPVWQGVIGFDEFTLQTTMLVSPPWAKKGEADAFGPRVWRDTDDHRTQSWLQQQDIEVGPGPTGQAIETVARENPYHPVCDYVQALRWDSEARAAVFATRYLGTTESPEYANTMCSMWLRSAVARIFQPGCQADSALVLEGRQGAGKSTALRILASDAWFIDSISEIGSKDACLQICGRWIVEMSELDSIRRAELTRTKAFLSCTADKFRPPYARRVIEVPRQAVLAGTTNDAQYLVDSTGNRRFWPIKCGDKIDLAALRPDRDQIWAEAYFTYKAGEPWWIGNEALGRLAETEAEARFEEDPWTPAIMKYCRGSKYVIATELAQGALEILPRDQHAGVMRRVSAVLRKAGWKRIKKTIGGERKWAYVPDPFGTCLR